MCAPRRPHRSRLAVTAVLTVAALTLASCGASDNTADKTSTDGTSSKEATTTTEAPPAQIDDSKTTTSTKAGSGTGASCADWKVSGKAGSAPKVDANGTTNVPDTLVQRDEIEGSGPAATANDALTVQYQGISCSTGEQFDASWESGQPFTFTPAEQNVIQGWLEGVIGMKAGGRRVLVIPPDLAYGAAGGGPIGPNETLFFVVDLVSIG